MPGNDKTANLEFPLGGLDVVAEFQEQKPGTTPVAVNVRAFDTIARRARGGSRPGIVHYAPDAVPANVSLDMTIQHLNVIVDPHATALPQEFETPGDDWVEDPLNPDKYVPPGGWGNPGGSDPDDDPGAAIALVQSQIDWVPFNNSDSSQREITWATPPTNGNIMVVIVATQDDQFVSPGATVTVTNTAGSSYSMLGTYSSMTKTDNIHTLSIWIREAVSGSNENTVKVTPNQDISLLTVMSEWVGMDPAGAFDAFAKTEDSVGANPMTVGPVTIEGDNEMVLAAYMGGFVVDTVTAPAGYTLLEERDGSSLDLDIVIYVFYKLNVDTGDSQTPQATWDGGADKYCAVGASFKD